ncbi:hypothetical protein KIPB_000901 [Kipferlia bialata]|uniref:Hcy-binding domain-containing protein n=1 Tax=Kipferlia bialata TaxID=797122 RepID=A0A9K3CPU7_9EUKA|nr:hypothetical protein KIPB_000901 [Kipferlia bialata]|eukprot:g901.t1
MLLDEIESHSGLLLAEAGVAERLKTFPGVTLDRHMFNSGAIYSDAGRRALQVIYTEYIDIARRAKVPLVVSTPTFRASRDRLLAASMDAGDATKYMDCNYDAAMFMRRLREDIGGGVDICIGGLIGPKNDCYTPSQGLTESEAREAHAWQISELVRGGVDCIIGQTLPCLSEAKGMAQALADAKVDYVISFVLGSDGNLRDGTPLSEAIREVDEYASTPPLGYMVNCCYPCTVRPGNGDCSRLLGIMANASSLSPAVLESCLDTREEPLSQWVADMVAVRDTHPSVRILGGCCGTDARHLEGLVTALVD